MSMVDAVGAGVCLPPSFSLLRLPLCRSGAGKTRLLREYRPRRHGVESVLPTRFAEASQTRALRRLVPGRIPVCPCSRAVRPPHEEGLEDGGTPSSSSSPFAFPIPKMV